MNTANSMTPAVRGLVALLALLAPGAGTLQAAMPGERWRLEVQLTLGGRPFGAPLVQEVCRPADWRQNSREEALPFGAAAGCPDLTIRRSAQGEVDLAGTCGASQYRLQVRYPTPERGEARFELDQSRERLNYGHGWRAVEQRVGTCTVGAEGGQP